MAKTEVYPISEMPSDAADNRPNEGYWKNLLRRCFVEFMGDLIFIFIGTMQAYTATGTEIGPLIAACAHGITIALLIAGMGHVSGGHFNPAVTVGVFCAGGIGWLDAIFYVVFQLFGGFCGSLLTRAVLSSTTYEMILGGCTIPAASTTVVQGIVLEAILTMVLVHSVLVSAVDTDNNLLAPFVIGLSIFVDILAGAKVTGASMNPARSLGPALTATIFGGLDVWSLHYIYYIGPVLGALLAAAAYRIFTGNDRKRWVLN